MQNAQLNHVIKQGERVIAEHDRLTNRNNPTPTMMVGPGGHLIPAPVAPARTQTLYTPPPQAKPVTATTMSRGEWNAQQDAAKRESINASVRDQRIEWRDPSGGTTEARYNAARAQATEQAKAEWNNGKVRQTAWGSWQEYTDYRVKDLLSRG